MGCDSALISLSLTAAQDACITLERLALLGGFVEPQHQRRQTWHFYHDSKGDLLYSCISLTAWYYVQYVQHHFYMPGKSAWCHPSEEIASEVTSYFKLVTDNRLSIFVPLQYIKCSGTYQIIINLVHVTHNDKKFLPVLLINYPYKHTWYIELQVIYFQLAIYV